MPIVTLCTHSKCALWAEEVPGHPALYTRAAQWFCEEFEPSQEASQDGFSLCHGVVLCASSSDCVVSSIVLSLSPGSVLETVISVLGGDPERQEGEAGKT